MVIENTSSFESSVQLELAPGNPDPKDLKPGEDINLVARFRDFLGEPTRDIGELAVSASKGTIYLPNGGQNGAEVGIAEGLVPVSVTGELPIVLKPGTDHGKIEVTVSCRLGESALTVEIPRPAGFALAEILESIIYAFFVAILIRIFFFQTFWIPSGSMEPTLYEGDRILANKLIYRLRDPEPGEVVIFRVFQPGVRGNTGKLTLEEAMNVPNPANGISSIFTNRTASADSGQGEVTVQDYIKRVIGVPGDVVQVIAGEIYINGELFSETYDTKPPNYNRYGPVTVPPGEVFVLGDNRSNSQDSHVIGTVPIRNIEGRAEAVFWPPNRIGLIPRAGD